MWRTSLTTTFRRASNLVNSFLDRKIVEGRDRANARGLDSVELADCVLDLVCARETGKDRLDDPSMRDELMQFLLAGQETRLVILDSDSGAVADGPISVQLQHAG
jgi:cytochrome P450